MTQSSVPPDPSAKRRRLIKQFVFIAASIVVLSVGVCAVQTLNRIQRNTANPVRTGSQLRQIGEALAQYASANAGQYPPSFLALMRAQPIPPELFVCPNSSDRVAKGHNREQILEEFAKPGHCSFVYVGAGLKTPVEAKAVVAFDNPNHEEEISNVLFGAGAPIGSHSRR